MDLKIQCLVLLKMLNVKLSMPIILVQKWKLLVNNVSNKGNPRKLLTLLYYSHFCTLFLLTYLCNGVMSSRSILHLFFTWRIRKSIVCSCYLESTKVAGVKKGVQCHCWSLKKTIFCFLNSVKGEEYFHYCTHMCFWW